MLTALRNGTIFTGTQRVAGQALLFDDERVKGIISEHSIPSNAEVIDCEGCNIAPGLIDLQIYGGGGHLFSAHPTQGSLSAMSEALLLSGTTGFLLTLATNKMDIFFSAMDIVRSWPGRNLLGLHFEGPYLNPLKKGAHPREFLRTPDVGELGALLSRSNGAIRMMTIAPEIFDDQAIELLLRNNIVLSAGHSNANFQQAVAAFNMGITAATHLFNAMPVLHHREPGLCGAIFQSQSVCASIIADGIHVDFEMVSIAKKILGERLFLITDAVEEAGTGPYLHQRQNDRFTLPDGTLSGSGLTQFKSVQNCVEKVGISLEEALRMASTYPARVIGAHDRGRIEPDLLADLIVFTNDFELKEVICRGKIYHNKITVLN